MAINPSANEAKVAAVVKAWGELAADKSFGGLTLAQLTALAKPALDAREELAKLDQQYTQWQNRRDDADKAAIEAIQKVVKGVVGDPAFDEDSDLYEAMGYIRKSERKSGLTKKKSAPPAK